MAIKSIYKCKKCGKEWRVPYLSKFALPIADLIENVYYKHNLSLHQCDLTKEEVGLIELIGIEGLIEVKGICTYPSNGKIE